MAKVTITIEDLPGPGNKVKIVAEPNFETMMKMDISGNILTSAHGYAVLALNSIRSAAKRMGPQVLEIPRVLKPH